MGCFTACFRKKEKGKNQELVPFDQRCRILKPLQPIEKNLSPEIQVNLERELSFSAKKRVTFDEIIRTPESRNSLDQIDRAVNDEEAKDGSSPASTPISHLPNNRYMNCRDSSDEETELNGDDLDLDLDSGDDEYEDSIIKKVWTEAILMESRTDELDTPVRINDSSPTQKTRDRTGYNNVYPVLNPVENISQWKVAKIQGTTLVQPNLEKENHDLIQSCEEPTFNSKSKFSESLNQEISVDASLSNWLDTSGTTTPPPQKKASYNGVEIEKLSSSEVSKGSNPMWSIEDRPILGALTVEEIKQFSASTTPKRSPNRSPEDMPIIGTVGTYWSKETFHERSESSSVSSCYKGTPNTARKYRENKKVNGHSTPFKTRLDRASRTNSPRA